MTDPANQACLLHAQISRTIAALKATGAITNRHSNGHMRVFRAAPDPSKSAARRKTTTTTITITTIEEQGQ